MMEAVTLLGLLVAAALAAEAAVLQLGSGRETWTTGIQYPSINAHIDDTLVICIAQCLKVAAVIILRKHLRYDDQQPYTCVRDQREHTAREAIFFYPCRCSNMTGVSTTLLKSGTHPATSRTLASLLASPIPPSC